MKDGVAYVKTEKPDKSAFVHFPLILVDDAFKLKSFSLQPGINPNFFLKKDGKLTHAVINGFLIDLSKPLEQQNTGNGLINGK